MTVQRLGNLRDEADNPVIAPMPCLTAGVALIIAFLAFLRPAFATDAGQVLTYNGDCYAVVGDQRTTLKMGDTVHVGDVLEVPDGARLKLQMADGSVLSLAANSRLTIQSYDVAPDGTKRDVKLNLDQGLVRAAVSKMAQESTFEVSTATGVAAARSTDWFVEYQQGTAVTEVSVLEGSVAFSEAGKPAAADAILIPPMAGSEILGKRMPTAPKPRSQADIDGLVYRTHVRLGLCQCRDSQAATIKASCLGNVDICKSDCGGAPYSFVPNAPESCTRMSSDTAVRPSVPR